ncbi:hypothetical protein A4H97_18480 [Niastella yeongjuensis]|uniref:Lipoprotein n=1 Tax=Niastella yeongjuensis TaxID=354355 RepID=A0A1V9DXW0_9BACT|nr:hypothetical protein [Niastella yeongjuensis]OQP38706.1 hypothetical protein A4H97_18480 [Niastella yeongjuensis]SEO35617.1 hypothetical protein SAMN05660816_02706 [Niastella yeongjuensis]
MQKLVLYSVLGLSFALLLVVACSKDKFQTKPSIEIKSISPNPLPKGGNLIIDLEYTDKEGDLATDSAIYIRKIRINQRPVGQTVRDSFWMPLPGEIPNNTKGTVRLTLDWENYAKSAANPPGNPPPPDSLIFRISMRDASKNASDTVESGLIIVEQ